MLYVPEPGQAPLSYTAAPFDPTRSRLSRLYGRGNLPNPNALQSFQAAQGTLQDDDDFRLSLVPGGCSFFFFFSVRPVFGPHRYGLPCLMVLIRCVCCARSALVPPRRLRQAHRSFVPALSSDSASSLLPPQCTGPDRFRFFSVLSYLLVLNASCCPPPKQNTSSPL